MLHGTQTLVCHLPRQLMKGHFKGFKNYCFIPTQGSCGVMFWVCIHF